MNGQESVCLSHQSTVTTDVGLLLSAPRAATATAMLGKAPAARRSEANAGIITLTADVGDEHRLVVICDDICTPQ